MESTGTTPGLRVHGFAVPARHRQPNKGNIIPCAGEGLTWTRLQNSSAVLRAS